jgi:hypothetical protein
MTDDGEGSTWCCCCHSNTSHTRAANAEIRRFCDCAARNVMRLRPSDVLFAIKIAESTVNVTIHLLRSSSLSAVLSCGRCKPPFGMTRVGVPTTSSSRVCRRRRRVVQAQRAERGVCDHWCLSVLVILSRVIRSVRSASPALPSFRRPALLLSSESQRLCGTLR